MTPENRPAYRPTYKALHRPLTVCGVDRRLFFLALLVGAGTFNLFYSLLAGCLMGGLLYAAAWSGENDPSGDEKFFSLARQARCIPIVATQSISSGRGGVFLRPRAQGSADAPWSSPRRAGTTKPVRDSLKEGIGENARNR